jgi:hypothetical protein|tara:strand:- start:4781 stop:5245 length:465 start_codon:yes stop_codon:yes gene_type:complete
MVTKKIAIKKSSNTVTGFAITLLLVIGFFMGAYNFLDYNITDSGATVPNKYDGIFGNLSDASDDIDDNTQNIKLNLEAAQEADSTFQIAINGFKALGNSLKLPLNYMNSAILTWQSLILPFDFLPNWVIPLLLTGLLTFGVLLVLRVMKGEPAV